MKTTLHCLLAASLVFVCACDSRKKAVPAKHSAAPPALLTLPELAARVRPSVFLLEIRDKNSAIVSTGTGFLITDNGWLVTNRHVIEKAHTVTAKAENGGRYDVGGIVAYDVKLDVVILQLKAHSLPFLPLRKDSANSAIVGESIAVVGSPLGLEGSLSNGVISAIRTDDGDEPLLRAFIQITAPISPGSSGSPVLAMNGEVIGIATLASRGGVQNLNFAIPSARIAGMIPFSKTLPFNNFHQKLIYEAVFASPDYAFYNAAQEKDDPNAKLESARSIANHLPDNPIAQSLVSKSLREISLFDEAIAICRKTIEITQEYGDVWHELGMAQHDKGELIEAMHSWDQAIVAYKKSLGVDPEDSDNWCRLGLTLSHYGRREEAIKAYNKAIEINPGNADTWCELGDAMMLRVFEVVNQDSDFDEAITTYRKSIEIKPKNAGAWYSLGKALGKRGNLADAESACRKSVEIRPNVAEPWYELCLILDNEGKLEEAIAAAKKCIEIKPEHPYAWDSLGKCLSNASRHHEAVIAYRKATEVMPERVRDLAWEGLGSSLSHLGKYDEAIAAYRKSIEGDPNYLHWERRSGLVISLIQKDTTSRPCRP